MKQLFFLLAFSLLVFGLATAQGLLIPNPDAGYFNNGLIEYNGKIYGNYVNADGKTQLVRFEGNSLYPIPNPDNGSGLDFSQKLILNGAMYAVYINPSGVRQFASFNGTDWTLIPNPDANTFGINGFDNMKIINGEIYTSYHYGNGEIKLARYNGNSWILVDNPINARFNWGLTEFDGAIYCTISIKSNGENGYNYNYLARYDGSSITMLANPDNTIKDGGCVGKPFVFNNALYVQYKNTSNNFQLAKYTDGSLLLISNPDLLTGTNDGYQGGEIVFNNELYAYYRSSDKSIRLSRFNGTDLILTPKLVSGTGLINSRKMTVFEGAIRCVSTNQLGYNSSVGFDGTDWVFFGGPYPGNYDANAPVVFGNALYTSYHHAFTEEWHLARIGGGPSQQLVSNPEISGRMRGYLGSPFVFKNKLYGAYGEYDGNSKRKLIQYTLPPYIKVIGTAAVTSIGQSLKLNTATENSVTKTWYSHSETEYWQPGTLLNGLTGDEINVTPQTTTYYSAVYTDIETQATLRSVQVRIPFKLTVSGSGTVADATYSEGRGVQLDSQNSGSPTPQYFIPTGADAGTRVYSTLFDLNLSASWTANFIIRKSEFWEIYQGTKSGTGAAVYTLLYRTKKTFPTSNSGGRLAAGRTSAETGTRPPQDAVWINAADNAEVALTLTGVSEDYTALPVTLSYFNAKLNTSKQVEIKWETASEQNSDYFEVERSAGLKSFKVLARIEAKNNSSEKTTYQVTDENPIKGINYYRLKQADLDGTSQYYRIATVRTEGTDAPYPNPSDGQYLTLDVPVTANINLTNLKGESMPFDRKKLSESSVQILPKTDLPPGLYVVTVNGISRTLVVQ